MPQDAGDLLPAERKVVEELGHLPLDFRAMAAVSTVLMISVGAMTQAGFAGNLRYIALPAAFVCVLAGAGWVWLVKGTATGTVSGEATGTFRITRQK